MTGFSPPRGAPASGSSSESERGVGRPPSGHARTAVARGLTGRESTTTAMAPGAQCGAAQPWGTTPMGADPRRTPERGSRAGSAPTARTRSILTGVLVTHAVRCGRCAVGGGDCKDPNPVPGTARCPCRDGRLGRMMIFRAWSQRPLTQSDRCPPNTGSTKSSVFHVEHE
jgi:hypothetical protein